MEVDVSGALAFSSWFVCPNLGSEAMVVSYIVDNTVVSMGVLVRVAALDVAVSISSFLSGLFEVTGMMVTADNVVPVFIRNWVTLLKKKKSLKNHRIDAEIVTFSQFFGIS